MKLSKNHLQVVTVQHRTGGRSLQSNSVPQAGAGEAQSHKGPWFNMTGDLELNSDSGIFPRWKEYIH